MSVLGEIKKPKEGSYVMAMTMNADGLLFFNYSYSEKWAYKLASYNTKTKQPSIIDLPKRPEFNMLKALIV